MLYVLHDSHVRPSTRALDLVGRTEVLGQPVPAGDVAVVLRDAIPEERRGHEVARVADVCITSRRADELRDLTVAVFAPEVVLMALERVGELVMLEAIRQIEPAVVAGVDVQVGEHLVHAAVLGVEHFRDLRIIERCEHAAPPTPAYFTSIASAVRFPA